MLATFNELAEAELNDAIGYYETEQIGLGAACLAEIRRSTAAIVEFPEASPIVRGTVRRRLCGRFPYALRIVVFSKRASCVRRPHWPSINA